MAYERSATFFICRVIATFRFKEKSITSKITDGSK